MSEPGMPDLRLAEVIAAISLAIDLGLGQPMEYFLRTCLLSVGLGEKLGMDSEELTDIYYLALLRHLGCTAQSHEATAVFGDDIAMNSWMIEVDQGRSSKVLGAVLQNVGKGLPTLQRARMIINTMATMPLKIGEVTAGKCEAGQRIAERLGMRTSVQEALGQVYERWDGRGLPDKLRGESLLPTVRVVQLAQDAEVFSRLGGIEAAIAMARQRAGGAYDPHMVECFCQHAHQMLTIAEQPSIWESVLAAEPGSPTRFTSEEQLDNALRAIADFVDLKSPYTVGHSSGVADLAAEAAEQCNLPVADIKAIRRAGWLHDLGRVGVSNAIWEKPGPLSEEEWERVRLHPYYTERVLTRLKMPGSVCSLAAQHHERVDGSGYHRGTPASLQPVTARILAAADVYHAMTEPRPHRPAQSADAVASELQKQVKAGLLDGDAVHAVLLAAGHRLRTTRNKRAAGLSDREIEVLRLVARGHSNREMAAFLTVSERTVHHHIQHIYTKIGVSTRPGATLFAMQHNLID